MIKSTFKKEDNFFKKVTVKGHALFGDYGTDIVCASVSTALIMTANAIEILGLISLVDVKSQSGFFELEVKEFNPIIDGLIQNLFYTFDELETQYNTYIKNQKEE